MSWSSTTTRTFRSPRSPRTAGSHARACGIPSSARRASCSTLRSRLGLAKKFRTIQDGLDRIVQNAQEIRAYNSRFGTSKEITDKCGEIIEIAGSINE